MRRGARGTGSHCRVFRKIGCIEKQPRLTLFQPTERDAGHPSKVGQAMIEPPSTRTVTGCSRGSPGLQSRTKSGTQTPADIVDSPSLRSSSFVTSAPKLRFAYPKPASGISGNGASPLGSRSRSLATGKTAGTGEPALPSPPPAPSFRSSSFVTSAPKLRFAYPKPASGISGNGASPLESRSRSFATRRREDGNRRFGAHHPFQCTSTRTGLTPPGVSPA